MVILADRLRTERFWGPETKQTSLLDAPTGSLFFHRRERLAQSGQSIKLDQGNTCGSVFPGNDGGVVSRRKQREDGRFKIVRRCLASRRNVCLLRILPVVIISDDVAVGIAQ